ncbi:MAG: glutaredoxin family protein [Thiobacillaceae bacterium]
MQKRAWLAIMLCLDAGLAAAGQVYRWMDERGITHYSDQPPPPQARKAEAIRAGGNVVEVDKEGYEMRRAREKNPVLLYVTDCGEPCDLALNFLAQRKIPYSRKNPQNVPEDAVELKRLVGGLEVPVIKVGDQHHKGFDPAAWEGMLTAAGYPVRIGTPKP